MSTTKKTTKGNLDDVHAALRGTVRGSRLVVILPAEVGIREVGDLQSLIHALTVPT